MPEVRIDVKEAAGKLNKTKAKLVSVNLFFFFY